MDIQTDSHKTRQITPIMQLLSRTFLTFSADHDYISLLIRKDTGVGVHPKNVREEVQVVCLPFHSQGLLPFTCCIKNYKQYSSELSTSQNNTKRGVPSKKKKLTKK